MEILLTNSPETLHAVKNSPVPFPFQAEAEKTLVRLGEQGNPEAAAKLADYQEIALTISGNFEAAKRQIMNPESKAAELPPEMYPRLPKPSAVELVETLSSLKLYRYFMVTLSLPR